MEQEILRLLQENNAMLREIVGYIREIRSMAYQSQQDIRSFSINVCADIVAENLKKEAKETVKKNFKL